MRRQLGEAKWKLQAGGGFHACRAHCEEARCSCQLGTFTSVSLDLTGHLLVWTHRPRSACSEGQARTEHVFGSLWCCSLLLHSREGRALAFCWRGRASAGLPVLRGGTRYRTAPRRGPHAACLLNPRVPGSRGPGAGRHRAFLPATPGSPGLPSRQGPATSPALPNALPTVRPLPRSRAAPAPAPTLSFTWGLDL